MESHKRESILNQDIRSMAQLLKETQSNLRLLNDKVGHLSVIIRIIICVHFHWRHQNHDTTAGHFFLFLQIIQQKFDELKRSNEHLRYEIASKTSDLNRSQENLTKLQNSYDLLYTDFK